MSIDKLVEECAREICVEMGNDPDADAGMVAGEGCATWECFTNEARAVIRRTLEWAAGEATKFLVGDPKNGVPLRNPMPHEIAERLRSLASMENTRADT